MPGAVYVALGAVAAALVAGFFSFSNLVSAKENKVSEFRQAWIDGLRNEIAAHTAAVQDLVRLRALNGSRELDKDWYEATRGTYRLASESLTKIQLRINPTQAAKAPNSNEAKLLNTIIDARAFFSKEEYESSLNKCNEIREVAAVFLKNEWERVKYGELRYQRIRDWSQVILCVGILFMVLCAVIVAVGSTLLRAS